MTARRDKRLAANLWLAVAYLAAAWLSLLLAPRPGDPSPLSLAAGIGIAALYSGGWRMLPGLVLATLLAAFLPSFPGAPATGPPDPLPALVLALAPLVQAAFGAALLRRLVDPAIASGRAVLRFLLLAPLICCVRASLSVAALNAIGSAPDQLGMYWVNWWMGDTIGVLLGAPLCWAAIGQPRPLWRPRRLLVALPLVLSATAFIIIYQQALDWERDQQLETFHLKAQEVGQLMQAALSEHERFIAGVARAIDVPGVPMRPNPAGRMDPDNFYEIARNYLNQRPELLAMAWLPRVAAAQRPALEAWASAFYRRSFALLDVDAGGHTRPAGPRPEYYPALLVEPRSGEWLLGRDFLSEPARARALAEAIRSRHPSASAPAWLLPTNILGIHLLQAVLSDGTGSAPAGMLDLVLRADTYLGRAVEQAGFKHFVVGFADTTDAAAPVKLIDNIDRAQHLPEYRKELYFGGRRYALRLAPDAAYLSAHTGWQSWGVLTGGLLLTGLMGALMLVISGERTQIQAQVDDSTARLREREARLQAILDNAADAIVTIDQHGAVLSANAAAGRLFVCAPEQLPGVPVERLLELPDEDPVQALRRLAQSDAGPSELAGVNSGGDAFPLSISASQVKLRDESIFVCIIHDLTEQRRAQAHIYQLAHHDTLTGLENRFSLNQHLDQLLAQARRAGLSVALLFLDLDHFKKINDSEGHQTGDLLLIEVAHRLKELMRDVDIIARLGGDEFIVVMAGALTPELVTAVAVRIVQSLGAPYHLDGQILHSGASVGIAMFPDDAPNAGILLRHADTAMYVAKSQGRGNFQFFSPAMNAASHERLLMENRIWNALGQRQFELYLQPQVALGSGQVVGAEALLRWSHPELGMIEPDRVIPIAEESGLILALGDWVLERAVDLMAEWKRDGMGELRMAVNLSARQFRGRELVPRLDRLLGAAGIDATLLELEITESAAMHDPEQTRYLLRQLRERGIQVAIDDFGTGYSSLNYLKLFAIDRIKIDRAFVTDIETDPNDAAIVTATIGLAHALGLTVVAEGVETPAQCSFLRSRACDEAQGFLFARPMPAAQFREFFARVSAQRALVP